MKLQPLPKLQSITKLSPTMFATLKQCSLRAGLRRVRAQPTLSIVFFGCLTRRPFSQRAAQGERYASRQSLDCLSVDSNSMGAFSSNCRFHCESLIFVEIMTPTHFCLGSRTAEDFENKFRFKLRGEVSSFRHSILLSVRLYCSTIFL